MKYPFTFHLSYNLIPETYNFYISRNFKIPLFNNSEHGTAESKKKNIRIKSITESNSFTLNPLLELCTNIISGTRMNCYSQK